MSSIRTSIEITSSPSAVRSIFLDFDNLRSWHKGFIKQIEQYNAFPNSDRRPKDGSELRPGHKLHNILSERNMEVYPTILANDEKEFRWRGKLWGVPGLFTGEHFFRFEESKEADNVGGTTFVHGEEFSGILTVMIREGSNAYKETKEGFEGFNRDLKAKAEKVEKK